MVRNFIWSPVYRAEELNILVVRQARETPRFGSLELRMAQGSFRIFQRISLYMSAHGLTGSTGGIQVKTLNFDCRVRSGALVRINLYKRQNR